MTELSESDLRIRHYMISELAETGRAPMLEDVAMEMGLRMHVRVPRCCGCMMHTCSFWALMATFL